MSWSPPRRHGSFPIWAAYAAAIWAVLFALVSFYWALGGEIGQKTILADIEALGRAREPWFLTLTGIMKLAWAGLALALVRPFGWRLNRQMLLILAWGLGVVLAAYGLSLFVQHALMLTGVIDIGETLGRYAAKWHFFFWDPVWMLGGALFLIAARQYQRRTTLVARAVDPDLIATDA